MTPEQLKEYLENWMNKAVLNGGMSIQDASNGLNALNQLYDKATGDKDPEKPLKTK